MGFDKSTNTDESSDQDEGHTLGSFLVLAFITISIISSASALAYYFVLNPELSKKKDSTEKPIIYVETQSFKAQDNPIIVEAMGRVVPAKETALRAQVSGKITDVSDAFIPGGYFNSGDTILNIDPTDYELDIKLKKAALRQAQASFELEQGQQAIAKDELKILERTTGTKLADSDLALRKPQLEQARANIASAKADLEMAELNLKRTELNAPYNAIITARNTNLGNIVSPNETLATLVSTDEYWIEAELPTKDMMWLSFPQNANEKGAQTTIFQPYGTAKRIGYLKNNTGTVGENSRLATIIVSVPDPLLYKAATKDIDDHFRLNLNDYVRLQIQAKTLPNSYKIPQKYIREGNSLWVYSDSKLQIVTPKIVHEDRNYAYIVGDLGANAQIITSDIITPAQGMEISLREVGTVE